MKKIYVSMVIAALGAAVGCSTSDYGTSGRAYESGSSMGAQDKYIHGGEQLNRIGVNPEAESVTPNQDRNEFRRNNPNVDSSSNPEKGTTLDKGVNNDSSNSIQPDNSVVPPDRKPDTELNASDPSVERDQKAKTESSHPE